MISEVVMPQMGADMVEGTIVRWLKHAGDSVERGEIIAEIETDKANVEIEAFESGVFRATLAAEGDVIPVGEIIAIIAAPEDDISKYNIAAAPSPSPVITAAAPEPTTHAGLAAPPTSNLQPPTSRTRISPVARNLAAQHNIDLRAIRGSGPDGRIIRRDIEAAIAGAPAQPSSPPTTGDRRPTTQSKMRQAIARRMSQSKREAPHYYLLLDIDMTDAVEFRRQFNETLAEGGGDRRGTERPEREGEAPKRAPHLRPSATSSPRRGEEAQGGAGAPGPGPMLRAGTETPGREGEAPGSRVSINDLIVRACALALRRYPEFNATLAGEQITRHDAQHVCIAIALDDGLIAPAILDAGAKTLAQVAAAARDLAERAKTGALRPREITDGTFTITNLGAYGVEALIGIIQPPQTAILGVGTVTPQPAVRDGAIVIRQLMKVALSADHRVTDGAQGAQFLTEIKRLLEHPLLLVL